VKRLAILSDLHLDINQLTETEWVYFIEMLTEKRVDHVHLAGDIANTKQQALAFIEYLSAYFPTTFHWGNHEMADLTETEMERFADSRFLNFRFFPLSHKTWLLGINGWYDYTFVKGATRDFERLKKLAWYDRFIHRDANDSVVMQRIADQFVAIMRTVPKDKQVIISTHFVPNQAFVQTFSGKYEKWNQINAFLGSPQIGTLAKNFPQVQAIAFGHTHRRFASRQLDGIHYTCRPLGYAYEWQSTRQFMLAHPQRTQLDMPTIKREWQHYGKEFYRLYPKMLEQEIESAVSFFAYEDK